MTSTDLVLDFTENWTLTKMRSTNVFGSNALLLEPQNYVTNGWEDFEDATLDLSNVWKSNPFTIRSQDRGAIDDYNYETDSPADGELLKTRALIAASPTNMKRLSTVWFWDDGNTGGGLQYYFTCQATAAGDTQKGILALGWDGDGAAPTKYVYSLSGGADVDTGINRSQGWHKLVLFTDLAITVDDATYTRKIFLDGSQIYSNVTTQAAGDPAPYATNWRSWSFNSVDAGAPEYHVEELIMQEGSTDIYEQGTAVLELDLPKLEAFNSVTIDETKTGAWSGTTTYQFQHAKNGGAYGSLTDLTTANLQALSLAGNGTDKIKITITHDPDSTEPSFIPKTNSITINYDYWLEKAIII